MATRGPAERNYASFTSLLSFQKCIRNSVDIPFHISFFHLFDFFFKITKRKNDLILTGIVTSYKSKHIMNLLYIVAVGTKPGISKRKAALQEKDKCSFNIIHVTRFCSGSFWAISNSSLYEIFTHFQIMLKKHGKTSKVEVQGFGTRASICIK